MPFSGDPLDRAANLRRDEAWVRAQLEHTSSRYLPFWRLSALSDDAEQPALLWLGAECLECLNGEAQPWLLGLRDGVPHFVVDFSSVEEPAPLLGVAGARFAEVRQLAPRVAGPDAGILAHARALLDWHQRHRFCGVCGAPTSAGEAGAMRRCEACGANHFPRTDPVVIMVVWREDRCLLGRKGGWGTRYSALAGFVDQGETIEEAVRREVKEEAGIEVDDVRYHASQPWPFPSSLMIGCFAHAATEDIAIDPVELEDARWFTRAEVRRAITSPSPELGFSIPDRIAIAHHLIRDWAELE